MAGIGLMNRRRAIQSAPVENEDYWDYYIQDSLLLCVDGLKPGDKSIGWQEIVSGHYFYNYGATYQDNGWKFDGKSYMDADKQITNYGFAERTRTLEVVVEFSAKDINSPVLIGQASGISFGISEIDYAIGNGNVKLSRLIPTPSLKCTVAFAVNNKTIVRAIENMENIGLTSTLGVWGAASAIRLGATSNLDYFLTGKIHAIRIHNRMLTEEEIHNNQHIDAIRFGL